MALAESCELRLLNLDAVGAVVGERKIQVIVAPELALAEAVASAEGGYTIRVIPRMLGAIQVAVEVDGVEAEDSPCTLHASAANAVELFRLHPPANPLVGVPCKLRLEGLKERRIWGQRLLEPSPKLSEHFSVQLTSPSGIVTTGNVAQKRGSARGNLPVLDKTNPGDFEVAVMCFESGLHTIALSLAGYAVQGDSLTFVASRICADVEGDGLHRACAGEAARFTLVARAEDGCRLHSGGALVRVEMLTPSGSTRKTVQVSDMHDGTYEVSYMLTEAGVHQMRVWLGEEELGASPFEVVVSPGKPHARSCRLTGAGLQQMAAFTEHRFVLAHSDRSSLARAAPCRAPSLKRP